MSAPIPSFFKMRLGLVILLCLLFFFLLGLARQAFSASAPYGSCAGFQCPVGRTCEYFNAQADALAAQQAYMASHSTTNNGQACWDTYCGYRALYTCSNGTGGWCGYNNLYGCGPATCPDTDEDGVEDVCDACPENPDISAFVERHYWLTMENGDEHYCGYQTEDCSRNPVYHPSYGLTPEQMLSFCAYDPSGDTYPTCTVDAQCNAVKDDKDGDGLSDAQDNDDDNDGVDDCQDDDADGDGIKAMQDPDEDPDCDGVPNSEDGDDDGDGVPDTQDPDNKFPNPAPAGGKDSDGDGIPDSQDNDDDNDGTPDDQDDDDDGDGIPDSEELKAYDKPADFVFDKQLESIASELGTQFSDRITQFVAEMRATSVFSIPDQILGSVPQGGGSSVITISTGETFGGDHEIDLANWSQGLAVIRGVLYLGFSFLAVRILFLKH